MPKPGLQWWLLVSMPARHNRGEGVRWPLHLMLCVETHLLHIDTTGQEVSGDEHTRGARSELAHDDIAGVLVHVAVGGRHRVVALPHLVSQPVHLQAFEKVSS